MPVAELLSPGSTAASSADFSAAPQTVRVCLKGASVGVLPGKRSQVIIELKDDAGLYWPIEQLNGSSKISQFLEAAGTYRVTRVAANANGASPAPAEDFVCGVFVSS